VRYWAANGRPGADTAFDVGQMKQGRRLATKILNASRFVLSQPALEGEVAEPLDLSLLVQLNGVIDDATRRFDGYDYTSALERVERFFWFFCDNYLELVKDRRYGSRGDAAAGSADRALRHGLSALLRMFAPFLPFVTEEVWSWWQDGSVHGAEWPASIGIGGSPEVLDLSAVVLREIRKAKSEANLSQRANARRVEVVGQPSETEFVQLAADDLREAGVTEDLVVRSDGDGELAVSVELVSD
jgi:valyl-tRNA synthetase